jgi:hypothetical protein
MSVIKRRTAFRDRQSGRFLGWAMATTTAGAMAEPFTPDLTAVAGSAITEISIDEMNQIDEVRFCDSDDWSILGGSGGDRAIMGGDLTPKTGR